MQEVKIQIEIFKNYTEYDPTWPISVKVRLMNWSDQNENNKQLQHQNSPFVFNNHSGNAERSFAAQKIFYGI